MTMKLTSSAFQSGEDIPEKFTCGGEDVSPPLNWEGFPDDSASFALICEDPDAPGGVFSHWVIYNIPTDRDHLPEGIPTDALLSWGAVQGRNDFGNTGYGGPCPPQGSTHSYQFRLFALDENLNLRRGLNRGQLLDEMEGHILEEAALMGRYYRS